MENLISKLEHNKNILKDCFSGIITVEKELDDIEISMLIDYLSKDNFKVGVGVVDTMNRFINNGINHCVVPAIIDELEEVVSFAKHHIRVPKANILRALPDYIIFRELISVQNIQDIIYSMTHGYNVIAFTNMSREELFQMVNKVMDASEDINRKIFNSFTIV